MIKKYKTRDRWILLSVITLSILGVIMVGSASIGLASVRGWRWAIMNMAKQIIFCTIGLFFMTGFSKFYKGTFLNRNTWFIFYIIMILALLSCLIWEGEKGTQAWIRLIPGFTIQPSEFTKIGMMILLAYLFVDMPKRFRLKPTSYYRSALHYREAIKRRAINCKYIPFIVVLGLVITVAFIQKDMGTAIITLMICVACFFGAREKIYLRYQNFIIVVGLIGLITSPIWYKVIIQGYKKSRFITWLNPLVDPTNTSQQVANALIAITNGGIFGTGLGNSIQKYGYVPEVHNDFITSVIFEELGLFGLALIMVPYAIIVFKLISYASKSKDPKTTIILLGIAAYFFLHLFINLGGVSGLIPMTGVPLLLVSSGGSSTLAAFIAIGIAQALISKDNKNSTQ